MKTQKAKKTRLWVKPQLLRWKPLKASNPMPLPSKHRGNRVVKSEEVVEIKRSRGRPRKADKKIPVVVSKKKVIDSDYEETDEHEEEDEVDSKKGGTRSQTRIIEAVKKESRKSSYPPMKHPGRPKAPEKPAPRGRKPGPKKEQKQLRRKSNHSTSSKRKRDSSSESEESSLSDESEIEIEPPPKLSPRKTKSPVKKEIKKKPSVSKGKTKKVTPSKKESESVISSDPEISEDATSKVKVTRVKKTPTSTPRGRRKLDTKAGDVHDPSRDTPSTKIKSTPKTPKTDKNGDDSSGKVF